MDVSALKGTRPANTLDPNIGFLLFAGADRRIKKIALKYEV